MAKLLRNLTTCVLVLALLQLTQLGCAKQPVVSEEPVPIDVEDVGGEVPRFVANVGVVEIIDDRRGVAVSDRLLHMPEWTIVGQEDEFSPVMDDDHRETVRDAIMGHFSPGKRTVNFEVYVLEGRQAFKVGEQKETITMTFALRVELFDPANVHDVYTAEGQASLSEEALDISYEQVDALYSRTIRESIRAAFERMRAPQ